MGNTQRHRYFVYIRAILFSIIAAMTSYQHTSFLGSFGLTDTYISIVYVAASLVSVCLVWYLALKKKQSVTYRKHLTFAYCIMAFALTSIVSGWGMVITTFGILILLCMDSPISFMTDEILELDTANTETGKTRSWYLSLQNLIWVVTPALSYTLVVSQMNNTYISIYTICIYIALILIVFQNYILLSQKSSTQKDEYQHLPFVHSIRPALVAHVLLHLFYVCMVTIFPIYLHTIIGWGWQQIGVALSVALIAFPLVQIPIGKYFDRYAKLETYSMPLGIFIMSFAVLSFIASPILSNLAIIALMFISRIGAALTESADETYIFRRVNAHHRSSIATFRSIGPLMLSATPLFFILKNNLGFETIFMFLGVTLVFGAMCVIYALQHIYSVSDDVL